MFALSRIQSSYFKVVKYSQNGYNLNMNKYMLLFFLLVSSICEGKLLKVAVIDTGLNLNDARFKSVLCSSGHRDFTDTGIEDNNGHGTLITQLIKEYAGLSNYCIIILKYHTDKLSKEQMAITYMNALTEAVRLNVDIVNISGGGREPIGKEFSLIKKSNKIRFIVSSGNKQQNLNHKCNFFPACYKLNNITVVGAKNNDGTIANYSNYGKIVTRWEDGEMRCSSIDTSCNNGYAEGTSLATAIYTGKVIYEISH